jgi:hypothetical protein
MIQIIAITIDKIQTLLKLLFLTNDATEKLDIDKKLNIKATLEISLKSIYNLNAVS